VRALSPGTAIVPGPDGCLVNGENLAGTYPLYHATSLAENSYSCTDASKPLAGPYFAVTESDFSLTIPGWFWNSDDKGLNASEILAALSGKLEQGANTIMNVPPNSTGVVEDDYVTQLALVGAARTATFSDPRAALAAPVSATCAQLSITIPVTGTFDTLLITEDLVGGQVIGAYTVDALDGASGAWRELTTVHGKTVGLRLVDNVGTQTGVTQLRFNCTGDLAPPQPPPSQPSYFFKNSAGDCMGVATNATWPCFTGGVGPFQLCPLVATECNARAVWTPTGMGWAALGVSSDAVINVDCDECVIGTHAKVISTSTCATCASALTFNETSGALQVDACAGSCLSNGIVGGALPSCAGSEPFVDSQVHIVPCTNATGSAGWTLAEAPPPPVAPPIATLAFFGAFLWRDVEVANRDSAMGPLVEDTTILDGCGVLNPGGSTPNCKDTGSCPDAETCATRCDADPSCSAATWTDSNQGPWALRCCLRSDNVTHFRQCGAGCGHVSMQKTSGWVPPPPPPPIIWPPLAQGWTGFVKPFWFGANANGLQSEETLALMARHAVAGFGWQQGHTGGGLPGHEEALLAAAATHARDYFALVNASTTLFVYRQIQVCCSMFATCWYANTANETSGFWLTDEAGNRCVTLQPWNTFDSIWDFRRPGATDWFVDTFIGELTTESALTNAGGPPGAVFFDEVDQNTCGAHNMFLINRADPRSPHS
jgi:hypothetical protein